MIKRGDTFVARCDVPGCVHTLTFFATCDLTHKAMTTELTRLLGWARWRVEHDAKFCPRHRVSREPVWSPYTTAYSPRAAPNEPVIIGVLGA